MTNSLIDTRWVYDVFIRQCVVKQATLLENLGVASHY